MSALIKCDRISPIDASKAVQERASFMTFHITLALLGITDVHRHDVGFVRHDGHSGRAEH